MDLGEERVVVANFRLELAPPVRVKVEHVVAVLIAQRVVDVIEDHRHGLVGVVGQHHAHGVANGMGTQELQLARLGLEKIAEFKTVMRPSPCPKKSSSGALTAGFAAPSQKNSMRIPRATRAECGMSVITIHMRRIVPGRPCDSASTLLSPGPSGKQADPLRPRKAFPARPLLAFQFSGWPASFDYALGGMV